MLLINQQCCYELHVPKKLKCKPQSFPLRNDCSPACVDNEVSPLTGSLTPHTDCYGVNSGSGAQSIKKGTAQLNQADAKGDGGNGVRILCLSLEQKRHRCHRTKIPLREKGKICSFLIFALRDAVCENSSV